MPTCELPGGPGSGGEAGGQGWIPDCRQPMPLYFLRFLVLHFLHLYYLFEVYYIEYALDIRYRFEHRNSQCGNKFMFYEFYILSF